MQMRHPDYLPNYVREKYPGLGGFDKGEDEEYAKGMVKAAKKYGEQGRTVPMSEFCRREELRKKFPIPRPLYISSPPKSGTRS